MAEERICVTCADSATQEIVSQIIVRSQGLHGSIDTKGRVMWKGLWEHFLHCLDESDAKSLEELIDRRKVTVEEVAESGSGHHHLSARQETDELLKKFTERLGIERK